MTDQSSRNNIPHNRGGNRNTARVFPLAHGRHVIVSCVGIVPHTSGGGTLIVAGILQRVAVGRYVFTTVMRVRLPFGMIFISLVLTRLMGHIKSSMIVSLARLIRCVFRSFSCGIDGAAAPNRSFLRDDQCPLSN